jgi:tetratricopeptide (TPR) repeat protein
MTPRSTEVRTRRRAAVLIAALAILPYLNGLRGEFVFDDLHVIRDNSMVQSEPLIDLFTRPFQIYWYRPLTLLTYVANDRLGETVVGYHVVNVVLHALVSLCVLVVGRTVLRSAHLATFAAAIFAVHPIHTEAVTSIVGRAELLAALFSLATVLVYARAVRAENAPAIGWHLLGAMSFSAGLLCKESAFTTLGLLPVIHWWTIGRSDVRRLATALAPYLSIGAAYLGVRYLVMGALSLPDPPAPIDNPLAYVSTGERVATALVILWEYVSQLAFPRYLSADYSFDAIPVVSAGTDPRLWIAVSALLFVALGLAVAARRSIEVAIAAAFFAVPLALTTNILFPIGTIKAERLLYLPSAGWCLLVAWLVAEACRDRVRLRVALLVALTLAYSARTVERNRDWNDNLALFDSALAVEPGSAKVHYNLGVSYELQGRLDEAHVHYRQALAIYPEYAEAAFNIANIYLRRGIDAGATHWFERALAMNWGMASAHLNLGILRQQRGEIDAAEAAFLSGLRHEPGHQLLLVNLAAVHVAKGNVWEAWEATDRVAARGPSNEPEVVALVAAADKLIRQVARP